MPCDTIQTSTLDLKNPNITLLMEALGDLGLHPVHHQTTGQITFRGGYWQNGTITTQTRSYANADLAARIKTAYSRKIVSYAAKQFGWKLEETKARAGVAVALRAKKR